MSKFIETLGMALRLIGARTLGEYVHSTYGPNQPPAAVYRWRGKTWSIPTGPISEEKSHD